MFQLEVGDFPGWDIHNRYAVKMEIKEDVSERINKIIDVGISHDLGRRLFKNETLFWLSILQPEEVMLLSDMIKEFPELSPCCHIHNTFCYCISSKIYNERPIT